MSHVPTVERRRQPKKRVVVGARVSGCFGEFIAIADERRAAQPNKRLRRARERLFGWVVRDVDHHTFTVHFDNGLIRNCTSNTLVVEDSNASLPPDLQQLSNTGGSGEEPEEEEEERMNLDNVDEEDFWPGRIGEDDGWQGAVQGGGQGGTQEFGEEETEQEQQERGGGQGGEEDGGEGEGEGGGGGGSDSDVGEEQEPQDIGLVLSYKQRLDRARAEIERKVGTQVTLKKGRDQITWTVVSEHVPDDDALEPERQNIGLRGIELHRLPQTMLFAHMFLYLAFEDWRAKVVKMNAAIDKVDVEQEDKRKARHFTEAEFVTGIAIMISTAGCADRGAVLWNSNGHASRRAEDDVMWESVVPKVTFDNYMKAYRFKEFRKFLPCIWEDSTLENSDPWWQFVSAISEFNSRRRSVMITSKWKVFDESMSAYRPRTTKTGNLPNLSFILRKPEPLGRMFVAYFFNYIQTSTHYFCSPFVCAPFQVLN